MNELTVVKETGEIVRQIEVTPVQLNIVQKTIFKDATPEELQLFLYDCKRRGVHPLDKLLHPTKRAGKYVAVTSIDLFRSRASETGLHAGTDDTVFVEDAKGKPISATVTVYRIVAGMRVGFPATAFFAEYCPKQDAFMWEKMPHTMIAKCAEALALRKGFPIELQGMYTEEEEQGMEPTDGTPIQQPKRKSEGQQPATAPKSAPQTPPASAPAKPAPAATPAPATTPGGADLSYDGEIPETESYGMPKMPSGAELDEFQRFEGLVDFYQQTDKSKKGEAYMDRDGQPQKRHVVRIDKTWFSTFNQDLGEYAGGMKGKHVMLWASAKDGYFTVERIQQQVNA